MSMEGHLASFQTIGSDDEMQVVETIGKAGKIHAIENKYAGEEEKGENWRLDAFYDTQGRLAALKTHDTSYGLDFQLMTVFKYADYQEVTSETDGSTDRLDISERKLPVCWRVQYQLNERTGEWELAPEMMDNPTQGNPVLIIADNVAVSGDGKPVARKMRDRIKQEFLRAESTGLYEQTPKVRLSYEIVCEGKQLGNEMMFVPQDRESAQVHVDYAGKEARPATNDLTGMLPLLIARDRAGTQIDVVRDMPFGNGHGGTQSWWRGEPVGFPLLFEDEKSLFENFDVVLEK